MPSYKLSCLRVGQWQNQKRNLISKAPNTACSVCYCLIYTFSSGTFSGATVAVFEPSVGQEHPGIMGQATCHRRNGLSVLLERSSVTWLKTEGDRLNNIYSDFRKTFEKMPLRELVSKLIWDGNNIRQVKRLNNELWPYRWCKSMWKRGFWQKAKNEGPL